MKVVKGSHRKGKFNHNINSAKHLALDQEVSKNQFNQIDVVSLDLNAGEISLHDDGTLHGSDANTSDRVRSGITMRFCPTNVKCDLDVWPTFEAYMARGVDKHNLNPIGPRPTNELYPVRKFQHSSEFI